MGKRKCLSTDVIRNGTFLDMPFSAQALYVQIGFEADDRGICPNADAIMRMIRADDSDMNILIENGFLTPLDKDIELFKDGKHSTHIVLDNCYNINNNFTNYHKFRESQYFDLIKDFKLTAKLTYSISNDGESLVKGRQPRGKPFKDGSGVGGVWSGVGVNKEMLMLNKHKESSDSQSEVVEGSNDDNF